MSEDNERWDRLSQNEADVSSVPDSAPSAEDIADLLELAERVKNLSHMSRSLSCRIGEIFGERFNYNFGYVDSANRLAIEGWSWCVGLSIDDDSGDKTYWANVHSPILPGDHARQDISVQAATDALALTSAWLFAHAQNAQAIEARSSEPVPGSTEGESVIAEGEAPNA